LTKRPDPEDLTRISELKEELKRLRKMAKMPKAPKAITPIDARLLSTIGQDESETLFQHSVLCQTGLPYRDPGDLREWRRSNGNADLIVDAGRLKAPDGRWVDVGLPFGPKSRVILMHLNQRALLSQSNVIDVGDSFTSFISQVLALDPMGRNLRVVRDQLNRLSGATMVLGYQSGEKSVTEKMSPVRRVELWGLRRDPRQRILWPETLELSLDYYVELRQHAVPLKEAHIRALSHSCLALDIYTWLAQRLHRIPVGKPQRVSWLSLWEQFGQGYDVARIDKFRQVFRVALKTVLTQYREARVEDSPAPKPKLVSGQGGIKVWRSNVAPGLWLYNSPPPVLKRLLTVKAPPE
jgi:hypothetical protein